MVQATIRYADGARIEAMVLSIDRYSMRVIPRDAEDTLVLALNYGQWSDEQGAEVEVEALISDGEPFSAVAGAGGGERLWQNGGL